MISICQGALRITCAHLCVNPVHKRATAACPQGTVYSSCNVVHAFLVLGAEYQANTHSVCNLGTPNKGGLGVKNISNDLGTLTHVRYSYTRVSTGCLETMCIGRTFQVLGIQTRHQYTQTFLSSHMIFTS